MTMPSRNDPCPCGSGKKYKACHMRGGNVPAAAERLLGPDIAAVQRAALDAARRARVWAADVAPIGTMLRESGEPGSVVIVEAGGLVVGVDVLPHRPVGPKARARELALAVASAGRRAGVLPARVRVRDEALAAALRAELGPRGVEVEAGPLPELDEALMSGVAAPDSDEQLAASHLWTWAESEASAQELAELHDAAAALYEAAPWSRLEGDVPLVVRFPGMPEPWAVSIMGGAGLHRGLAMYSRPGDMLDLLETGRPDVAAMHGEALTLSFGSAADLSGPMRREVARAGWRIAGPRAHPHLMGLLIPGLRITAEHVRLATTCSRAITSFVTEKPERPPWTDSRTGVEVTGNLRRADEDGDDDDGVDELLIGPWVPSAEASPVGPRGPGADPWASLPLHDALRRARADGQAREERFEAWVRAQELSGAATDRLLRTAKLWTDQLCRTGVPASAATEYSLRHFLYGGFLLGARRPGKPLADHLTRSLRTLFEFYAREEGIEYPWANAALDEFDALVAVTDADVRDLAEELQPAMYVYLLQRGLVYDPSVPGTEDGWYGDRVGTGPLWRVREELIRRWLVWYDEVVESGVTDVAEVREVLVRRQRDWESTPHSDLDGRTPAQALRDAENEAESG